MEPSNTPESDSLRRPHAFRSPMQKNREHHISLASTPSTSSSASSLSFWSRPGSSSSSSSGPGTPASEVVPTPNGKEEQNEFARTVLHVLSRKTPHFLLDDSSVNEHDVVPNKKDSEPIVPDEHTVQDTEQAFDEGLQSSEERDISSIPTREYGVRETSRTADVSGAQFASPGDRINPKSPVRIVLHEDPEESDISTVNIRNVAAANDLSEFPKIEGDPSQNSENSGASSASDAISEGETGTPNEDASQSSGTFSSDVLRFNLSPPEALPMPTFSEKQDNANESVSQAATVATMPVSKEDAPAASREKGLFRSVAKFLQRSYYLTEEPTLVLPSPPDDKEKVNYLITHRVTLCIVGVFAFLTSSAGIWLFTLCANVFYWFGLFAGFLQLYLALFHLTGLISKNFDYELHEKIKKDYAVVDETAPTVDIYLPCCKEPLEILENTYKYVQKMEYPEGRLKVHVLDDGAMEEVKALAAKYGFNYICRDDRPRLKKAGNLRWAFARTDGEYFVIYDADFCPRHDYLTELIPRMRGDPNIAIIQTPQYFRTLDNQTWVERGAGAVQELFYRYIQVNRNKWGGAICVGSNAMYRREALAGTGGTAEVGASEDVHTGFYAVNNGWSLSYIPLCLACGICPDNPRAFFSQQVRWCEGSTSLLLNWHFWGSKLTKTQKMCYLSGMLYYSASALTIFLNPLPGILLMWFRIEFLLYYNLVFAIPSLLYGWFIYRIWSRSRHALCVQFIGVIQQYAYLSALKDRIFGTSFAWVPSGDNKAHQSPRYRNMRWFCIAWTFTYNGFFIAGCTYRLLEGHAWYNFLPLILLQAFMLYKALPFMLAR